MKNKEIKFAFFGTPKTAVEILNSLKKEELVPSLIVTSPDRPKGRGMEMTKSPVKIWAEEEGIEVIDDIKNIPKEEWDLFIVVAFGKILPKEILNLPKKGSINLHYSLLPQLRGSSPVEGAILEDIDRTGVTTILMDEKMDHGPILLQEVVKFKDWPVSKSKAFKELNRVGGEILAETINLWMNDDLDPQEQNEDEATYVSKILKKDALINLEDDPYLNYRKILAYEDNPKPYFLKDGKRVVINKARFENGKLEILRITPEGKKEIDYSTFSS